MLKICEIKNENIKKNMPPKTMNPINIDKTMLVLLEIFVALWINLENGPIMKLKKKAKKKGIKTDLAAAPIP